MTNSDHRELRALESRRDAQINRIYWLQLQALKRLLTADEQRELERLNAEYRARS